jgi:hypothetical protein
MIGSQKSIGMFASIGCSGSPRQAFVAAAPRSPAIRPCSGTAVYRTPQQASTEGCSMALGDKTAM